MNLKHNIATAVTKSTSFLISNFSENAGSNFPGRLALSIDDHALENEIDKKVSGNKIIVVGTNGKTSVTNLLALIFEKQGKRVVCNRGGANLKPGITTAVITSAPGEIGVFESDELWLKTNLPSVGATHVLLLNLFRDQLDRCGEIERIQSSIAQALGAAPNTTLIYNADDPLCEQIAQACPNKKITFGIDEALPWKENTVSDTTMCQNCDSMLEYEFRQYDKLGKFFCPRCDFKRAALDCHAQNVQINAEGIKFRANSTTFASPLTGTYNVYNLLACVCAAGELGANSEAIQLAFNDFNPQNGRLETFDIAGQRVLLNLAKNPTGFNQNLRIIANSIEPATSTAVVFFINDLIADGRDVSWLWDIDFEELARFENVTFFAGGSRKEDMCVRLKYANIASRLCETIEEVLATGAKNVFAIANYTALPPVKRSLDKLSKDAKTQKRLQEAEEANAQRFDDSSFDDSRNVESSATNIATNSFDTSTSLSDRMNHESVEALSDRMNFDSDDKIVIAHILPELLNLYGDGGNVKILQRRLQWRGIPVEVRQIFASSKPNFDEFDLVVMGGSPDREQELASRQLQKWKAQIANYIEQGGPLLAICGSYQVLGKTWLYNDEEVEGLGILDLETRRPGTSKERLVSNIALATKLQDMPVVGFENHAGRTFLVAGLEPFGKVESNVGEGNNENDHADGVLYKNTIGTYLHGPALSKNPQIADWLLENAIARHAARTNARNPESLDTKCAEKVSIVETAKLAPLDDAAEQTANAVLARQLR